MADVLSASPDSVPIVKFSVGEESVSVEVDSLLAQDGHGDAPPRSSSRFKVAKVEFVNEPEEMTDERPTPASPATPPPKENGIVRDGARGSASERLNSESTSTSCSPHLTDGTYSYDTHNLKTFGHNTLETLPHLDHYRNLLSATGAMRKRPTLLELHEHDKDEEEEQLVEAANNGGTQPNEDGVTIEQLKTPQAIKFGWIKGVLVRCLLNIYGVMLFLRLSWVVGQAGVALTSLVILLSAVVTMITALSMSAICTNGQVKGGGAYFMISRSLGPEFGGAIGLVFSMANAVAVAMYVVGFAETIRDLLKWNDLLMIDEINDVRVIGAITIIALLGIALIGMEWETRAQLALLAILLIAIANFAIGTFLPPSDSKKAKGFVGYQADVFKANWGPDFSAGEGFFSVFSIFFPAATGILAGANISGDLADAQSAIPKGTLLAILISMSTYVAMAWMAGSCMLRSVAIGGSTDWIGNGTLQSGYVAASVTASSLSCVDTKSCPYGLLNDMQMMQLTSAFGPITVAGIISATLSSALASLVSAPKVFQAVCKDKIFPGIHIFARGYGKSEEPRLAYILAFCIGLACIGIGQLNAIAPLISNFFLMSYALINYSCFDASLAKSPGWRPAFRYYSMWLSLLGAVICLVVMFIISWYTAFVTLGVVATLYTYVHYRKPDVNWGSSTQAHVYRSALQHTLKLTSVLEHVKNFRPQLLVMSGFPADRPALVDIAANISKNVGLMVCGQVIQGNPQEKLINTKFLTSKAYTWMHNRKVKAFYSGVTAQSLRAGAQCLLQGPGIGKLRPNTLLLGFKTNWLTAPQAQVVDYINIIHDAFDLRYGVGILRLADGLHCSEMDVFLPPDEGVSAYEEESGAALDNGVPLEGGELPSSGMPLEGGIKSVPLEGVPLQTESSQEEVVRDIPRPPSSRPSSQPMDDTFRRKHKGTIDVWWLFDDGGLTLLIPYLLTTNSLWQGCKLRVFAAGTKTMELDRDQRHMATLLSKFRIEYSSMTVVQDIGKRPDPSLYTEFCSRLGNWMLDTEAGETEETHPWKISENELSTQKEKTFRNIRLRQLLKQYSSDAKLIVMTLPMPKKGLLSSGLYMAWLDTLNRDMPPILLLRGNQTSVLTYYS